MILKDNKLKRCLLATFVFLGILILGTVQSALAADIRVDNTNGTFGTPTVADCSDVCDDGNDCDIWDAIAKADQDAAADTIVFSPTVFDPASPVTITTTAFLELTTATTIQGPGADVLTIDATAATVGFLIDSTATGAITISGLTITDGSLGVSVYQNAVDVTLDSLVITTNSFAIRISDSAADTAVTIKNSTISDNTSPLSGGGVQVLNLGANVNVTILDSLISGNTATAYGAGVFADNFDATASLNIENTRIYDNSVSGGVELGGGLGCVDATVTISDSSLMYNTSATSGGGIYADLGCDLTVTNSQISYNDATSTGGGLFIQDDVGNGTNINVSISNSDISANSSAGLISASGISVRNAVSTVAFDLTHVSIFANNSQAHAVQLNGDAADIAATTLNITDSTFSTNDGGALSLTESTAVVSGTTFYNNHSNFSGGAVVLSFSDTDFTTSSFINNTAASAGGAIYNSTTSVDTTSTLSLINSTFSGNVSDSNGGGAIYNDDGTALNLNEISLLNVTVANNSSQGSGAAGGGIYQGNGAGSITTTNSIVANNFAGRSPSDCYTEATGVSSGGNNFIGTDDGCANNTFDTPSVLNDQVGTLGSEIDPELADLNVANGGDPANGVDTAVLVPNPGSPVIDAVDASINEAPDTDQRGVNRPIAGEADIGAVEAGCGDGVVQEGEACDDGDESATCNNNCTVSACGDGEVNATAGEECDDAGESADCNVACTEASCGDGVLNTTAGEECEDGNTTAGDGCSSTCQDEFAAVCGDGILQGGETCDDGNLVAGDACDDLCQTEVADSDSGGGGCSLNSFNNPNSAWLLSGLLLASLASLVWVKRALAK